MKQTLKNKRAEVSFRRKLAKQHFENLEIFPEEYSKKEMQNVIRERIKKSTEAFQSLKNAKIALSPFLEIGAGYGQSSLVLTNKYNAKGFALDISFEPLKMLTSLSNTSKLYKKPSLVVGDAEELPFGDNSFAFVFTYQTIHHFPTPEPVFKEINRVLSPGGAFFMAEEPVSQGLNLNLWRRPTKLRLWEKILKGLTILPFISKIGKTEVDYGIIEGDFPISVWKKAFSKFESVKIEFVPYPLGPTSLITKQNGFWKESSLSLLTKLIILITGGGISVIATKKGTLPKLRLPPLACPKCKVILKRKDLKLYCPNCREIYITKNKISVLLTRPIKNILYPNVKAKSNFIDRNTHKKRAQKY